MLPIPRQIPALLILALSGCGLFSRRYVGPSMDGSAVPVPNPLVVPVSNVEFTWNQIVDTVDNYFDIASEQQVQEIGGVLMEGRIESQPLTGATCLEPLRKDSTPGFERLQSTLQSVRRRASVRVIPVSTGFQVYIEVHKELEDVSQPEFSTVARGTARRHDNSLVAFEGFRSELGPVTLGWIYIGRDETLEQEMLRQLYARLFETATAQP